MCQYIALVMLQLLVMHYYSANCPIQTQFVLNSLLQFDFKECFLLMVKTREFMELVICPTAITIFCL